MGVNDIIEQLLNEVSIPGLILENNKVKIIQSTELAGKGKFQMINVNNLYNLINMLYYHIEDKRVKNNILTEKLKEYEDHIKICNMSGQNKDSVNNFFENNFEINIKKEISVYDNINPIVDNKTKINLYIKDIKENNEQLKININKFILKINMFIVFLKFRKSSYYENKIKKIKSLPPEEETDYKNKDIGGKNRNRRSDKTLSILERYPIIVYDDIGNSVIKQLIAKETELIICYKNDIADKIKKKVDNITINDVVDYIAKHDNLSYQKKSKLKYLFERCEYLYKQYGQYNKLNKFKFNIASLPHMNKQEWMNWVLELDKLIKIYYPKENICQHIMASNSKRPGQICGKVDCKNHNIS